MSPQRNEWQWCRLCQCVTNHMTSEHEQAEQPRCRACDAVVKDDLELCSECSIAKSEWLSEQASYYAPDEGGESDA